ncbi:MAG: hypothetical protein JSV52_12305 [Candidatus Zixiibacteriota bacterium]|nr:MAG: hypothetical protein JSV52_12305 [candidate division Zixibacteria bacterium]
MRAFFQALLASLIGLALLLAIGFGCSSDSPTVSDVSINNDQPELNEKPVAPGRGENLIDNPGFEYGFSCWQYSPDAGWSISTDNPHGGEKCARYTAPGGSGWVNVELYNADYCCVHIDGNSPRYRFSYWGRMERPDGAYTDSIPTVAWAWLFLAGGTYHTSPMQLTESWQRVSAELTVTGSGCGWIWVQVIGDANEATLAVALDDFELRSY